jgi:hypothetical protein
VLTPSRYAVYAARKNAEEKRKERAMIARFDHRPILTAVTLATVVCVLLLMVLLLTAQTFPESVPSDSPAGGPPAHSDIVQTMML